MNFTTAVAYHLCSSLPADHCRVISLNFSVHSFSSIVFRRFMQKSLRAQQILPPACECVSGRERGRYKRERELPHAPPISHQFMDRVGRVRMDRLYFHSIRQCDVTVYRWDLRWKSNDWFDAYHSHGVTPKDAGRLNGLLSWLECEGTGNFLKGRGRGPVFPCRSRRAWRAKLRTK